LREKGKSEEEIAAAFFVSVNVVHQRLRLSAHSDERSITRIPFQNREQSFGPDGQYAQRAAHEDVERPHDG
jgi:hypothetical protein